MPLEILPGAEVRIHAGMDLSLREGRIASLNGGQRYLLVEFPYNLVPPGTREVLFQLLANDITPVLAHPERNEAIQRNPEVLADLVDRGCLAQLTAMSVTGELGHAAMACAHLLLQRRLAHVMATDAHDVTGRPPILSRAVDAVSHLLGDGDAAASLVMNNPRAILNGKPVRLASKGSTTAKRGWWQRWGDSIGSVSRRRM
jgi:protein-tyrosine phosphatase